MTGAFLAGVIAGYGVAVPVGAIAVLIAGLTARTSLRVGAAAGLGAATADGVYALIAVVGGAALATAIAPIATPLRWAAAGVLMLLAAHMARSALRSKPAAAPGELAVAPGELAVAPGEPAVAPGEPVTAPSKPAEARSEPVTAPGEPAEARSKPVEAGPDPAGTARVTPVSDAGAGAAGSDVGVGGVVGPGVGAGAGAARSDVRVGDATTPGRAFLGVLGLTLLNPATVVYFAALVLGRGGTGGGAAFVAGAFLASASWQLLVACGGALVGRLLTGERGRRITAVVSSLVIAVLAVGLIT